MLVALAAITSPSADTSVSERVSRRRRISAAPVGFATAAASSVYSVADVDPTTRSAPFASVVRDGVITVSGRPGAGGVAADDEQRHPRVAGRGGVALGFAEAGDAGAGDDVEDVHIQGVGAVVVDGDAVRADDELDPLVVGAGDLVGRNRASVAVLVENVDVVSHGCLLRWRVG